MGKYFGGYSKKEHIISKSFKQLDHMSDSTQKTAKGILMAGVVLYSVITIKD